MNNAETAKQLNQMVNFILKEAAFYGTPAAVKVLLNAGADPSIKNDQGLTAVDFAQRNSRQDSAELIAGFMRGKQPKGTW